MSEENSGEDKVNEFEKQQNLLNHIINLLPTRIFWKDKDLCYLGCNKIFAKDAGKESPEELIGKDDYAMGWKDQANLYRKDDMAVINTKERKINFEEPQTKPDGTIMWASTSKVPLTNEKDEVIGVLGMYTDITEKKEAETKMNELVKELQAFKKVSIGRELKMVELKKEINDLSKKLGRQEPYRF